MKQLNLNVYGTPTAPPTLQIDADPTVYTGTLAPGRCWFILPDSAPPHGATVRWQDQSIRLIVPPTPGFYEADLPPVQPPDGPRVRIEYRPAVLSIQGDQFYREGKRWIVKHVDGFPWFDRFMRGQSIEHLVQEAISLGANGARVFFSKAGGVGLGDWADLRPGRGDYNYEAIAPFLTYLEARGLTCEMTHGDLQIVCPSREQQQQHFARITDIARRFPGTVLFEYANEAYKNGLAQEVVVKVPGLLCSRGSSLGDDVCPTPALDWAGSHGRRDSRARILDSINVAHHQDGGWENIHPGYKVGRIPVVSNEPIGASEIDQPGRRSNDPSLFFEIGRIASAFNGATFHSDAGLYGEPLGPVQRRCAEAFFAGLSGAEDWR